MIALIDRHHSDLFYAMQRLFEDRLGGTVYTPVGHEWWDEGYWRFGEVFGDDRLAQQYLGDWSETYDRHHPDRLIRGLTVAQAREMRPDFVVATVQENQPGFRRFADEVGGRYVLQVGNARQVIDMSLEPILLDLGQEFDHLTTFGYREPVRQDRITSFVNSLPLVPESWWGFDGLQKALPEYEFRSFGHNCPDGFRDPASAVADEMAEAGWAYHDKVTGDGFGHVIHDWAAVGRPLIGHSSYYAGQRAEGLWVDGETCIDLSRRSLSEAVEIIRNTTPEQHRAMCLAIRERLLDIYDPDADAEIARARLLQPVAA